jgi:hypothetical protein
MPDTCCDVVAADQSAARVAQPERSVPTGSTYTTPSSIWGIPLTRRTSWQASTPRPCPGFSMSPWTGLCPRSRMARFPRHVSNWPPVARLSVPSSSNYGLAPLEHHLEVVRKLRRHPCLHLATAGLRGNGLAVFPRPAVGVLWRLTAPAAFYGAILRSAVEISPTYLSCVYKPRCALSSVSPSQTTNKSSKGRRGSSSSRRQYELLPDHAGIFGSCFGLKD